MFDKSVDKSFVLVYDEYRQGGLNMAKKETKQDKTLDQVLADIEKQFGKGSIMKLGENNNMEIEYEKNQQII